MKCRQLVIPVAPETYVTFTVPESMTAEAVDRVEREAARMLAALRQERHLRPAVDPGALEYASWSATFRHGRA